MIAAHAGRPEYGSDLIVDVLRGLGIEYAALNPGATFRGLHDSLVNYGRNQRPELIQCCHEEIAVAVAHGYAKAAGRPMAAIVHNVVGLQHAAMAIFNAWCDQAPILVLGGTGPMAADRRRPWIDWIHTALVQGQAVRDYVKWDDQPASVAAIPESLVRGHRIAVTEPRGPVYVCFDAELQEMRLPEPPALPDFPRFAPPSRVQADAAALDRAAALLRAAERPVIVAQYAGRTPAAAAALVRLAEALEAPVIDLFEHGRFNFPSTHPLDLTDSPREVLASADVVLALDVVDLHGTFSRLDRLTRVSETVLPDGAKVIHITMAEAGIRSWVTHYQRLAPVDVPILADTAVALPALLARLADGHAAAPPARAARAEQLRRRHAASGRMRAAAARPTGPPGRSRRPGSPPKCGTRCTRRTGSSRTARSTDGRGGCGTGRVRTSSSAAAVGPDWATEPGRRSAPRSRTAAPAACASTSSPTATSSTPRVPCGPRPITASRCSS